MDQRKIRTHDVDWETQYSHRRNVWEQKPHTYSVLASKRVRRGCILDIGCGEGYDCLYFAAKGYEVTGVDISRTVIKRLRAEAKRQRLHVRGRVADITTAKPRGTYDIVVSYGVLHFLGARFPAWMKELKARTKPGGIHALYVFGNEGDFYAIGKRQFYFPSIRQLRALYQDWTIIKIEETWRPLLIRGDRGERLFNSMFKILVQKPL
ncbi:methyltransferase domain-containing protein [Candidatus Uhrbacteria bacterium]|nr:methyltransferase domain-containing protein [Candidatus Uhrbacteria bacterium]